MRKYYILFFIGFACSAIAQQKKKDPVLATVGKEKITKSEFEYVFQKSNGGWDSAKKQTVKQYEDYLNLYIKFRMKVADAKKAGLDKNPQFQKELEGYRAKLAPSHLIEKEVTDKLIEEAYQRSKYEICAGFIAITMTNPNSPLDTAMAYRKLMAIRDSIVKMGKSFEEMQKRHSMIQNDYNLDKTIYFSVFDVPSYIFETVAYNTPVGEVSMPMRSRDSYFILKVYDKRPNRGKIKVAHIVAAGTKGKMKPEDSTKAVARINEALQELKAGKSFEEVARTYSEDNTTKNNGGVINEFVSASKLYPEFAQAAFALKNVGDYSEIVRTPVGWHIIKLIAREGEVPFQKLRPELKRNVLTDRGGRSDYYKYNVYAERIKKQNNYSVDMKGIDKAIQMLDTLISNGSWRLSLKCTELNYPIMTIGKQKYSAYQLLDYADKTKLRGVKDPKEIVYGAILNFSREKALEYDQIDIEKRYPEFKYLMNEYRDGLLLFQQLENRVWKRASEDTVGLRKYYEAHKNDPNFQTDKERIKATIYTTTSEEKRKQVQELLEKKLPRDSIAKRMNKDGINVTIEEDYYAKGINKFVDMVYDKEVGQAHLLPEQDKKFIIVYTHKKYPPGNKVFEEVRPMCVTGYQEQLEKEWIAELEKTYPVKINRAVLETLYK
ncbi:MAG: peptidylprolyl isomerase [Bacteroidia bacterium]|nr:peptidylprolyl isomerase [Bacteroidia bacterium]MDW8302984.1 peptidylprolyl isomerase [Bacteroidia bacterium]